MVESAFTSLDSVVVLALCEYTINNTASVQYHAVHVASQLPVHDGLITIVSIVCSTRYNEVLHVVSAVEIKLIISSPSVASICVFNTTTCGVMLCLVQPGKCVVSQPPLKAVAHHNIIGTVRFQCCHLVSDNQ